MIEPYITEKQCALCGECKPLTAFSPSIRGAHGVQSNCRKCRSDTNAAKQRADRRRKPETGESPSAWNVPAMSASDSIRCAKFSAAMASIAAERRPYL